jgi:hypothetical protein
MRTNVKHRRTVALPALFLAVTLLGACGNSDKKSTSPANETPLSQATAVGMSVCTRCHTVVTADWMTSKHANLDPGGALDSPGNPTLAQISGCAVNCHDPGGDSASLVAGYTGNIARPVVGCEACHGAGSLHAGAGGAGPIGFATSAAGVIGTASTVQISSQFATCTSCHELLDASDPANTPASASHGPSGAVTPTGAQYTITDTHFAKPSNWSDTTSLNTHVTPNDPAIVGFAMDFNSERVCSDCHNPHKPATINLEWAQSAHADRFGERTGFFSSAWAHYNWSCDGTNATACGVSSGVPRSFKACQRCHTTTGFVAYADAIRTGNTAAADAIRLGTSPPLAYTPNFKPEMLKCNGCHTDNRGNLRNPGAVTANYDLDVTAGVKGSLASFAFPDLAGSNVCMLCHIGRENGETIKGLNDPALLSAGTITATDFTNRSFINSHYLTGGATVFTVSGYEFGTRTYENIAAYRHDKIGTSAAAGTGASGPCIGCHMSRPNRNGNHLFLPVSRDATGVIGIASEVCFTCHGPSSTLILDLVKEQRELYHESLEALKLQLEKRGFYFRDFSPYFFQLRTNSALQSGATATLVDPTTVALVSVTTPTIVAGTSPDFFRFDGDGIYYQITAVNTATNEITLSPPFAGAIPPVGGIGNFTVIGSSTRNWLTSPDTDKSGAVTGKNNHGAAFNFNLLDHDPGAYVHNRIYVKRLIYDSIDWLDDNQMNYSVGETLNALNAASTPFKAGAMTYLLPNGILGIAAERP